MEIRVATNNPLPRQARLTEADHTPPQSSANARLVGVIVCLTVRRPPRRRV